MSLVVNTNIGSLNAQRSLSSSGNELKTAMERLSSGKKINSAADDAAGFAIAERMTAQIRGLNMATKNANDGLSMLAVIENATNDVTDMLQRMRELAVQAANDTNSVADRGFLQKEAGQLLAEINRVASQTQYNGQTVLDGSYQNKSIQVGTDSGQTVEFSVAGISTADIGSYQIEAGVVVHSSNNPAGYSGPNGYNGYVEVATNQVGGALSSLQAGDTISFDNAPEVHYEVETAYSRPDVDEWNAYGNDGVVFVAPQALVDDEPYLDGQTVLVQSTLKDFDITTNSGAQKALLLVTSAIEQVSMQRAEYGALQNRLEYTVSNLMNVAEFTTAARSRIEDADFAAESARLAKAQVLQQTGTAMLAQANSSSQLVMSLIR